MTRTELHADAWRARADFWLARGYTALADAAAHAAAKGYPAPGVMAESENHAGQLSLPSPTEGALSVKK